MVFDLPADGPQSGSKRSKQWSPIERMLQNKRSNSEPVKRKERPAPKVPSNQRLPPLAQSNTSQPSGYPANAVTQTRSWSELLQESLAPERQRSQALQQEARTWKVRAEKAEERLKQIEDAEGDSSASNARIYELEGQLTAALQKCEEERFSLEKAKAIWEDERAALQRELNQSLAAKKEDGDFLRAALEKEKTEKAALSKKSQGMEVDIQALTAERDELLKRLEEEQKTMVARVHALEEQINKRSERSNPKYVSVAECWDKGPTTT